MIRPFTFEPICLGALCLFIMSMTGCGTTSPETKEGIDGAFIRAAPTWDLNHDGNVTCDEWKTYALSLFKENDINHDGKLTPDEFARLSKIDRLFETADFKYYDVNNQGYLTQADFVERPNPAFAALDKDHTCVLKTHQLRASSMPQQKKENPGLTSPAGR